MPIKKPKHLRGQNHQSAGLATQQEAKLARRLGGRVTKGSGNQDDKGDVVVPEVVRVECKTTEQKSYGLTLYDVNKIEVAARNTNELPVLVIQWTDPRGKVLGEVAVLRTRDLDDVIALHRSNRLDP